MRKIICVLLTVITILSANIPVALAAHHGYQRHITRCQAQISLDETSPEGCRFVDKDQNVICDNCDNICTGCKNGKDEDCDGICDSCSKIWHKCSGLSDSDGDGICDGCGMCPSIRDTNGMSTCRCVEESKKTDENGHCAIPVSYRHCTRGIRHH